MPDKSRLVDIAAIRSFYETNPLILPYETVDFDFLNLFVHSKAELDSLVLDIINTGHIQKQASVRFHREDTDDSLFVLVEKESPDIHLSVIIQCISESQYRVVSVFPTVTNASRHMGGHYFPDDYEIFGRVQSAVGLPDTDIFDSTVLFENDYFSDNNHDDVEWNMFGVAYSNSSAAGRYNDFDCVDDIYPYRKVSVRVSDMEQIIFNGIVFYKCYTDAALFLEYCDVEPGMMGIKIPLYISEKSDIKIEELHDGSVVDAVIFGSIRTY